MYKLELVSFKYMYMNLWLSKVWPILSTNCFLRFVLLVQPVVVGLFFNYCFFSFFSHVCAIAIVFPFFWKAFHWKYKFSYVFFCEFICTFIAINFLMEGNLKEGDSVARCYDFVDLLLHLDYNRISSWSCWRLWSVLRELLCTIWAKALLSTLMMSTAFPIATSSAIYTLITLLLSYRWRLHWIFVLFCYLKTCFKIL